METFLRFSFVVALLLLLARLNPVSLQKDHDTMYFAEGGQIKLRPNQSGAITSVLWKHEGNLVVDWSTIESEIYGDFKGRTDMDSKTAVLTINSTKGADQGAYTVRINLNSQNEETFHVKVVRKLTKPRLVFRPLTCSPQSTECRLYCEEDNRVNSTDPGPISYTFKRDDTVMNEQRDHISVSSGNSGEFKTFSCSMKSQISEEQSDTIDNIFYVRPINIPAIVFGVLGVLACVGGAGAAAYMKRDEIRGYFSRVNGNEEHTRNNNGDSCPENVALQHGKTEVELNDEENCVPK